MGATESGLAQPASVAEAEEVKQALIEADRLLAKCLQPGWEERGWANAMDSKFPPSQSTISHDLKVLNAAKARRFTELRWLRAEEALGGNTGSLPVFPPEGPMAADVRQGMLGDCYFLAALNVCRSILAQLSTISSHPRAMPSKRKSVQKHVKVIGLEVVDPNITGLVAKPLFLGTGMVCSNGLRAGRTMSLGRSDLTSEWGDVATAEEKEMEVVVRKGIIPGCCSLVYHKGKVIPTCSTELPVIPNFRTVKTMADVKSVLATPGAPHLDVEVQLPAHRIQALTVRARNFSVTCVNGALQTLVSFLAGGAYGLTSVAVGQPLDTVKTRMSWGPAVPGGGDPQPHMTQTYGMI
eukprot:s374_g16.t1